MAEVSLIHCGSKSQTPKKRKDKKSIGAEHHQVDNVRNGLGINPDDGAVPWVSGIRFPKGDDLLFLGPNWASELNKPSPVHMISLPLGRRTGPE